MDTERITALMVAATAMLTAAAVVLRLIISLFHLVKAFELHLEDLLLRSADKDVSKS